MSRRGYRSPFRAGIIAILLLAFLTYYGFKKDNPFSRPFHIGVVVQNSAGVKKGSVVRIAGVDVGKVRSVERYNGAEASLINMDINANGLPVHEGATVRIRPRLFLEGNFVLDLSPGAPGSPTLKDGDTIPLTQSSRSVQLDEVLTTLQGPERKDLQVVLQQLGKAFGTVDDSDNVPLTKGQTAGQSLKDTIKSAALSGTDVQQLARALQGEDRGDLAAAIKSFAKLTGPLADNRDELAGLIDGLDRTVSVFSSNASAVRAGIEELPKTVDTASRTLPVINKSLDPIDAVAKNVTDGLDQVPALVKASGPFLDQTAGLLSDDEAGGLVKSLEPITSGLAKTAPSLASILNDLDELSVCTSKILVPTANQKIQDGQYTTGLTSWDEFLRGFTGLASASQNYDANGLYGRAATSGGSIVLSGTHTQKKAGSNARLVGSAPGTPGSSRPAKPSTTLQTATGSPWKYDQPCSTASVPNLSAVPTGPADGTAVN